MVNGIINVHKEKGFTSHDVVAKLRGIVGQKKIGHTGTLDPDATGVLPVCLGKGTKLCDLLTDKDKTYEAILLLGQATDTQDTTGSILHSEDTSHLTPESVSQAILSFIGEYNQIPPMYSALKVNGKKLYELAREGKVIERQARPVVIKDIEILEINLPRVRMSVTCSKGTYIRTLCHDIGLQLNNYGCMENLIRTRVSSFDLEHSYTLGELQELKDKNQLLSAVQTIQSVFPEYEKFYLPIHLEFLALNGNPLPVSSCNQIKNWEEDQGILVYLCDLEFLGLYQYKKETQTLKLKQLFLDVPVYKQEKQINQPTVLTLGKFDGLHIGHQSLIDTVLALVSEESESLICSIEAPFGTEDSSTQKILGIEEKLAQLPEAIDHKVNLYLTDTIKSMSAKEFIKEVLVHKFKARHIVVGENFKFGQGKTGDGNTLARYAQEYGYTLHVLPQVRGNMQQRTMSKENKIVSSTYIKEEIKKGNMEEVSLLLGYHYYVTATVIKGNQLGRTIGFPTMNLKIPTYKITPPRGVYVARITIDGRSYQGIANVGCKPTVSKSEQVLLEVHVLDYKEDTYGKVIKVELLRYIRGEEKFSSINSLKEQISRDILHLA